MSRTRLALLGVAAIAGAIGGCGGLPSANFPNPPRQVPVAGVVVSANGRVITGVGGMACGRDPRLVARSYPRKVTLTWVNPDTNCNAETLWSAVVRTTLPQPLGSRPLVQASGGGLIPYFSQRDLARVTVLPARFRLRGEFPAGRPALGVTRIYTLPGVRTLRQRAPGFHVPAWPGELAITQQLISKSFIPPTMETSQHPAYVRVHGLPAALLVNGPSYARSVNWADHGYYFTVGVSANGHHVPLNDSQLIAVADGIQLLLPGPNT